jgi:hypothetical protein
VSLKKTSVYGGEPKRPRIRAFFAEGFVNGAPFFFLNRAGSLSRLRFGQPKQKTTVAWDVQIVGDWAFGMHFIGDSAKVVQQVVPRPVEAALLARPAAL